MSLLYWTTSKEGTYHIFASKGFFVKLLLFCLLFYLVFRLTVKGLKIA